MCEPLRLKEHTTQFLWMLVWLLELKVHFFVVNGNKGVYYNNLIYLADQWDHFYSPIFSQYLFIKI